MSVGFTNKKNKKKTVEVSGRSNDENMYSRKVFENSFEWNGVNSEMQATSWTREEEVLSAHCKGKWTTWFQKHCRGFWHHAYLFHYVRLALSYFTVAALKHLEQNGLVKGGSMSAHSLSRWIIVLKSQWQKFEADGHIASTVKKKSNKTQAQLASFYAI